MKTKQNQTQSLRLLKKAKAKIATLKTMYFHLVSIMKLVLLKPNTKKNLQFKNSNQVLKIAKLNFIEKLIDCTLIIYNIIYF